MVVAITLSSPIRNLRPALGFCGISALSAIDVISESALFKSHHSEMEPDSICAAPVDLDTIEGNGMSSSRLRRYVSRRRMRLK
jgi:hypothetical protein